MILETIIGLVGVTAAYVTGRNTKPKPKTPPSIELSEDAKLAEFAERPKVTEEQFIELAKLIQDYAAFGLGDGKAITRSNYPNGLIVEVMKAGYRFNSNQIAKLNILLQEWPCYGGKIDMKRVRDENFCRTSYELTAKVEAEEVVTRILNV